MTVKDIIADYLKKNGFDGLCDYDCGCGLDDLFPCESEARCLGCEPAYKHTVDTTGGGAYDKYFPEVFYSPQRPK